MGQKINPKSFRLPVDRNWSSRWFDSKNQAKNIAEDFKIRQFLSKKLGPQAAIAEIEIERSLNKTKVFIFTGRPGVVIGRMGQGITDLSAELERKFGKKITIEVQEIKKPELSAQLVASNIAGQIERRLPYRRVVKNTIQKVMESGAKGIKIIISGRLGGAEIARREKFSRGALPLSTLRAKIDYALVEALTTYGTIGIKVYIYIGGAKGEE